jgi:hypothetical protein
VVLRVSIFRLTLRLHFSYQFTTLSLNLHQVIELLTEMFLLSCAIPGLVILNKWTFFNGLLLILHSVGLALLEQTLYEQEEGMYPYWLVILTTSLGVYIATRYEIFIVTKQSIGLRKKIGSTLQFFMCWFLFTYPNSRYY